MGSDRNGLAGGGSFEAALRARRAELAKERDEASARLEEIRQAVARLDSDIGHIDALLGEPRETGAAAADGMAGQAAGNPAASQAENPAADLVVELLRETGPLHYREIERELRARGAIAIEGKNPANTLLSRFFNDQRLYRPKRGTYALRDGRKVRSVGARRVRARKEA